MNKFSIPAVIPTEADGFKIGKLLARFSRLISEQNIRKASQIFYDALKFMYYRLRSKAEQTSRPIQTVALKEKEITGFFCIVDFLHNNIETVEVQGQLQSLLGGRLVEDDYWRYFEEFVEGQVTDRVGRLIKIDVTSIGFMYKDAYGEHTVRSDFFQPSRGKRLPWIKKTLQESTCIFRKVGEIKETFIYVMCYQIKHGGGTSIENFVVIVSRNKKAKNAPYEFKTAYSIGQYNRLIKILEPFSLVGK